MQHLFPSPATRIGTLILCGAMMLAAACNAAAQTVRVGGTGSALGTVRLLADAFNKREAMPAALTIVPNLGSSGAIRALQAGAIDVALISRPLKPEEAAAGLLGFEYGRSPFVFVTSKSGVKHITASMVADVLSGRAASWPDGQPVRFVMRPQSDGDNVYLASLAPAIDHALKIAHTRPGMVSAATDQEAADEAERLPGSLAVNTLALVLSEHRKLNVLAFDGATPSVKALASGTYPYFKPLLIVTRSTAGKNVQQFVEFFKSPQGRAILEANGHVVTH